MKHVHRSVEWDNNQMSIKLEDHKTALSGKYAYLHMPRDVYNMLLGYCKLVRQGKADEDSAGDQPVFGTRDEDACHSAINKWLKGAWKNSGMEYKYQDFKMTLMNNRKWMRGLARGEDPSKADAIAQYMKHNKATADKHYSVHHQLGHSQRMYQWLEKVQMKKAFSTRSATAPNLCVCPPRPGATTPMSRRYPFFRLTLHLPRCYPPPLSRSYPLCHHRPHLPQPRSYPPSRSYLWSSLGCHAPPASTPELPTVKELPVALPGPSHADPYLQAQTAMETGLPDYLGELDDVAYYLRQAQEANDSDSEHSVSFVFRKKARRMTFESDNDAMTPTTSLRTSTGSRKRVFADETCEISEVFTDDITQSANTGQTVSIIAVRTKRTAKMSQLSD